ncbi:MAG: glycosyltransferase [Acidobacteria bacterium]|nr:glycosyltransferase [Acidobacteriota bacterium]
MKVRRILIVGEPGVTQLGHHLRDAATTLGVEASIADTAAAYRGSALRRRILWRLAGHRPVRLGAFSGDVLERVRRERPDVVVTTGIAPIDGETLEAIGRAGVRRINFLTDDPWNRVHRAPWFLEALRHYDHVWSPRHANMHDLRRAGVRRVDYLAFGYNPNVHWMESIADDDRRRYGADVLLAGGADPDRVAWVAPLLRAGFTVALYGGYWNRYRATRRHARGFLDAAGLRKATGSARVCLGLVRRANRDGHSMRTFEVPAMGGCLLAERTSDHERLFGHEGERVFYAASPADVVSKVRWLLANPSERDRLSRAARAVVTEGRHTYGDRLGVMLGAL